MRKTKEFNWGWKAFWVVASLMLVLMLGLLADQFSMVSHAQSQGKVTASSAKIRKEADPNSEVIGSASKDASVTINNQVTASDNTVWYQIFVDANTLGYIRSDLVQITDGTTPPTASATLTTTTTDTPAETPVTTPATNETPVEVTAVEPLSASVTGGQSVRVRSNASTTSQIVTTAQSGLALTVTGQATGTDGNVWYQVNFISNGTEVSGFIRSDYVSLSGELVPAADENTDPATEDPQESEVPDEPVITKDWDTQYVDGTWYLVNYADDDGYQYKIQEILDAVDNNKLLYDAEHAKAKSQKAVIIILVILLILAAAAATVLIFKIKDMRDSAYFAEVERETVRRRTADRPQGSGQKVMHTVGAGKKQPAARPAGTRPAGASAQGSARPGTARPAGAAAQGTAGQGMTRTDGARPAGTRPAGAAAQGTAGQGMTRADGARPAGTRPAGTRPAGAAAQGTAGQGMTRADGARPAGTRPAGTRSAGASAQGSTRPGTARPAGAGSAPASGAQQGNNAQNPGWKSKNFMTDDDEFEFEFLNWDGEEDQ